MKWILMIGSLFMLSGCQAAASNEEHIRILFFADEMMGKEKEVEQLLMEQIGPAKPVDVSIYPLSREKFSVLLAERAGDVYVTEPAFVQGLLTQNGLTPLDELMPPDVQDDYTENRKTGERHLYGLPVQRADSIFAPLKGELPDEMTAILPSFSSKQEESKAVLRGMLDDGKEEGLE